MINADAFSSPTQYASDEDLVYYLGKNIAAIQVLPAESSDEPKLGMITQLPQGAQLHVCGRGFNERTVRVRWADGSYFVFLQDLEAPLTMSATA